MYATASGNITLQVNFKELFNVGFNIIIMILIQIVSFVSCKQNQTGFKLACALYLTNNPFSILSVKYNWVFQIATGYNKLYLQQEVNVEKGYLVLLWQATGKVALDQSGNASFSDLEWYSFRWSKLNENSNWRFYLNTLNEFSSYLLNLNLVHTYKSKGLYTLNVEILDSSLILKQTVNVTQCKFFFKRPDLFFWLRDQAQICIVFA